jgi:similar to stage IV sporulation protein
MGIVSGSVLLRIISADISGLLDELIKKGIAIQNTRIHSELEAEVTVSRKCIGELRKICEKRGDKAEILRKNGLSWKLESLFQRPVLVSAMIFYLALSLILPTRVFFLRVVGNTSVPTQKILEAANECGIGFGASRRAVRSEKMKNALLDVMPELMWAGVNTHGCVAEISVRERAGQESATEETTFAHIVASLDGIITSCNAIKGNLLCAPGQAVAAGDILISGFTDCGLAIRAEQAQGEVYALTNRNLTTVAPASCLSVRETGEEKKKISLIIGKKRINLWKDSGFWDVSCDRMYEENYITLPGDFQLPLGWSVDCYRTRKMSSVVTNPRELLEDYAEDYLKSCMVAGTIRNSEFSVYEGEGFIQLTGEYSCVEMIGFMQRVEIGEIHGKDN